MGVTLGSQSEIERLKIKTDEGGRKNIYRKILKLAPMKDEDWAIKRRIYQAQGRLNDALRCFKKANKSNPKRVMYLSELGLIYLIQGNHKLMIDCCKNILKLNPEVPLQWNNMGVCYEQLKQPYKDLEFRIII